MNALKMNDMEIHSLDELRHHFDLAQLTAAFLDGALEEWLSACYYEREADAVMHLEHVLSPAIEQKLCTILGISQPEQQLMTPEQQAAYERKCAAIRRSSTDGSLLAHALETATDQAELAELLDGGYQTVYLCEGSFSVPIRKSGIHYIGIGDPKMEAAFTEEQYRRAGITFSGIHLPEQSDQNTARIARDAARENGYDDFGETHTRLASILHFAMKADRLSRGHHLNADPCAVSGEFYKSRGAAEKAARQLIEKAYAEANSLFEPDSGICIAPRIAAEYASILTNGAKKTAERLKPFCADDETRRFRLADLLGLILQAEQDLRKAFEKELRDSADYYRMYEKSYFFEQLEIKKNDYDLDLFDSDLLNGLARLIHDDSEYTVGNLFELVAELEEDVNKHADTFYGVAWQIYRTYCGEIEKIAEEIGRDLSDDDLVRLGISETNRTA